MERFARSHARAVGAEVLNVHAWAGASNVSAKPPPRVTILAQ